MAKVYVGLDVGSGSCHLVAMDKDKGNRSPGREYLQCGTRFLLENG